MTQALDSKILPARPARKMSKMKTGGREKQMYLPLLDAVERQGLDSAGYITALLQLKPIPLPDRIAALTPPNSVLDHLMRTMARGSNLPLELPMSVFLAYLSACLVRRGVVIRIPEVGDIAPTVWCVILGSSGCGKSYTQNRIAEFFRLEDPEIRELTGAVSAAAMLASLYAADGRGLWVKDEYGQFIRIIQRPDQAEYKDYLLRSYDGQQIVRTTKKDGVTQVTPLLSLIGLSVRETWPDMVGAESLVDGLAQRYLYVIAHEDPNRHYKDYPIWSVDISSISDKWDFSRIQTLPAYTPSPDAIAEYCDYYRKACSAPISESFIRRITWATHKIALCYHIVLGEHENPVISSVAYGWATRYIDQRIIDAQTMLNEAGASDLARVILQAQGVADRRAARGLPTTPRDLISGVAAIKSISQAQGIARMLSYPHASQL